MYKKSNSNISTIATVIIAIGIVIFGFVGVCGGCTYSGTSQDIATTQEVADNLQTNQPTPNDIDYSLERYNLIRRAYWVNGQRDKAATLPCEIEKPLGYIVLMTENGSVVNRFVVDGKVSSLNSFLTPDSEYYEYSKGNGSAYNEWLADVDGSYGENDKGIFFFTPAGNYIEWTGTYLYTDMYMEINEPVITFKEANND